MYEGIKVLPIKVLEERSYQGMPVTFGMLRDMLEKSRKKLVVLDDDPTGVQTVHGVCVYTDWRYESVLEGFQKPNPVFFILTNSRALQPEKTVQVHKDIADAIVKASEATGKDYIVVSRGDSTLRGHYRKEMDTLRTELERRSGRIFDGEIFCPFFLEGGRFTIDDVHYVKEKDSLISCAQTEFAKDRAFGYHHSDLKEYLKEKLEEQYREEDVRSISLEELVRGESEEIRKKLTEGEGYKHIIVNAISMEYLNMFAMVFYQALEEGKRFLIRSAASLVKSLSGIGDKPYLTGAELRRKGQIKDPSVKKLVKNPGGLVIVGSYTQKTTEQLEQLKETCDVRMLEFDASTVLLSGNEHEGKVHEYANVVHEIICAGKTVVVYTSRTPVFADNITDSETLELSVKISEALQQIVRLQKTAPAFLIAKGGITSSDIGVKALGIRCAEVMGQAAPGVPVWRAEEISLFPNIAYIIFPGNVGDQDTLSEIVKRINDAAD